MVYPVGQFINRRNFGLQLLEFIWLQNVQDSFIFFLLIESNYLTLASNRKTTHSDYDNEWRMVQIWAWETIALQLYS